MMADQPGARCNRTGIVRLQELGDRSALKKGFDVHANEFDPCGADRLVVYNRHGVCGGRAG
jgi:hypothetical protein